MTAPANLLITGGTGFFGRALLRLWQADAASRTAFSRVMVLSRDPQAFLTRYPEFSGPPWLGFHTGDILDPHSLPTRVPFTHLLHAATDSTLGPQMTPLARYQHCLLYTSPSPRDS